MIKFKINNNHLIIINLVAIFFILINFYQVYSINIKNESLQKNTNDNYIAYTTEDYTNIIANNIANSVSGDIRPIGSIYITTEDDTEEKVENRFGGEWEVYSDGITIIGADDTYSVNSTGGSNSVTLLTENLPSHNHSFTASGKVSSTFTGTAVNSSSNGKHNHGVYGLGAGSTLNSGIRAELQTDGNFCAYTKSSGLWCAKTNGNTGSSYRSVILGADGTTSYFDNHYHSVTAKGSVSSTFTGIEGSTSNTGSGTAINVQNPYTVVYMYKRTA